YFLPRGADRGQPTCQLARSQAEVNEQTHAAHAQETGVAGAAAGEHRKVHGHASSVESCGPRPWPARLSWSGDGYLSMINKTECQTQLSCCRTGPLRTSCLARGTYPCDGIRHAFSCQEQPEQKESHGRTVPLQSDWPLHGPGRHV